MGMLKKQLKKIAHVKKTTRGFFVESKKRDEKTYQAIELMLETLASKYNGEWGVYLVESWR